MKKQLLWSMLLLMAGFSSCRKDSFKQVNQTSVGSKDKLRVASASQNYYYVDLLLQPRAPGENYDTYAAMFGLVKIIVTGTPSWNHDLYPNLQNGVPTVVQNVSIGPGYNAWLTGSDNSFVVNVGVPSDFNNVAYQNDVNAYDKASSDWQNKFLSGADAGIPPLIWNYVKDNYSTQAGVVTTTGKLIRVTTGSQWAVATINYPAPTVAPPPASVGKLLGGIYDPNNSSVIYEVYGSSGYVTSGSPNIKLVSGTYTATNTPNINIVTITITRLDGTSFQLTQYTTIDVE
ncbi:hypothetical protein ACFJIV_27350 [Mucilaginibacter sp. UC70_90]